MLPGITKEYYDAVVLSEKLWEWLADNPLKRKEDSPYWNEIKNLDYNCPLCEYNFKLTDNLCNKCILSKICFFDYTNWRISDDENERFKLSNKFYQAILKERLRIM